MSQTLSAAFNALDMGRRPDQERQARASFVALLGAMDRQEEGNVRRSLEQNDAPSRFHLEDRTSGTGLSLEIGARERGHPDRVLTLSFTSKGKHILSISQTRRAWNEQPSSSTFLKGTVNDLLTLSGAMTQAETLLEEEKACPQLNNPVLQTRPVYTTLGDALGKTYESTRNENALAQGNQAQCAIAGILDRLDRAQNGEIHSGFEDYDRLSLFVFEDGDLSIGVQISPRAKLNAPRTLMISVLREEGPVLEVSLTKAAWKESFMEKNLPTFHTGNLQTLLNLNTALKDSNFLSSHGKLARPKDPVPA